MPQWNQAQQELVALIKRIFADGKVEESERKELRDFWSDRKLTVGEVRQVVESFAAHVWGEANADRVITPDEKQRLWTVVNTLHLPEAAMPPEMWQAISGKR